MEPSTQREGNCPRSNPWTPDVAQRGPASRVLSMGPNGPPTRWNPGALPNVSLPPLSQLPQQNYVHHHHFQPYLPPQYQLPGQLHGMYTPGPGASLGTAMPHHPFTPTATGQPPQILQGNESNNMTQQNADVAAAQSGLIGPRHAVNGLPSEPTRSTEHSSTNTSTSAHVGSTNLRPIRNEHHSRGATSSRSDAHSDSHSLRNPTPSDTGSRSLPYNHIRGSSTTTPHSDFAFRVAPASGHSSHHVRAHHPHHAHPHAGARWQAPLQTGHSRSASYGTAELQISRRRRLDLSARALRNMASRAGTSHRIHTPGNVEARRSIASQLHLALRRYDNHLTSRGRDTKRVASRAALKTLEKVLIDDLAEDQKTCDICYVDYGTKSPEGTVEKPVRIPGCKHVFGEQCLRRWLSDSFKCPVCRAELANEPFFSYNDGITTLIDTLYEQRVRISPGLEAALPHITTHIESVFQDDAYDEMDYMDGDYDEEGDNDGDEDGEGDDNDSAEALPTVREQQPAPRLPATAHQPFPASQFALQSPGVLDFWPSINQRRGAIDESAIRNGAYAYAPLPPYGSAGALGVPTINGVPHPNYGSHYSNPLQMGAPPYIPVGGTMHQLATGLLMTQPVGNYHGSGGAPAPPSGPGGNTHQVPF